MSVPLVDPVDLAVYMSDPAINSDRAALMIDLVQTLCESIVSPLPDAARVIVLREAANAYTSVLSPRQRQQTDAGSPFGGGAGGGVRLSDDSVATLRRMTGSGGVFSVDLLPAGYVPPPNWSPLSDWDVPS